MASDVVEETKNQRFHRIAGGRVDRAVEKIALLHNLASSNYESSLDERKAIIDKIQAAVNEAADAFQIPMATTPAPAAIAPAEDSEDPAADDEEVEVEAIETEAPTKAKLPKKGEYIKLTDEDELIMLRIGQHVDRAISMIDEGNPQDARDLLHTIMVS